MATKRFASHTDSEIETKKANVTPKATKDANGAAAKVLKEYLKEIGQDCAFEEFSKERLNELLTHFYLDVRTKQGNMYKMNSLESLRHGINRYLRAPPFSKKFDILKDSDFLEANESFKTAVKELKAAGLGSVNHHPEIIECDRQKLYTSMHLNPNTPCGLLNKVQFDVRLYFCRRGLENMANMTKSTFAVKTDGETGMRYVVKDTDELSKNHRNDKENFSGFMPEEPGSVYCPVSSFENYLSKLNKKTDRLWQYPKDSYCDTDEEWFANKPMGRDSLGQFMTKLSKQCNLSQVYTNHSIHVTGATILSRQNFAASQIMAVTGHKSVSSVSVYQRVSDREKLEMGMALKSGISPTGAQPLAIMPPETPSFLQPALPPSSLQPALPPSSLQPALPPSSLQPALPPSTLQPVVPLSEHSHLSGTDLNSLFCDFNSLHSTTSTNNSNASFPFFNNCTIGSLNITINK